MGVTSKRLLDHCLLNVTELSEQVERANNSVRACQAQVAQLASSVSTLKQSNNATAAYEIELAQKEEKADAELMDGLYEVNAPKGYTAKELEELVPRYTQAKERYEHELNDVSTMRGNMRCIQ